MMFWGIVSFFAAYLNRHPRGERRFRGFAPGHYCGWTGSRQFLRGVRGKEPTPPAIITGASLIGGIGGLLTFSANLGLGPAVAAATGGSAW